jgi:carboxyl-terminal processing protease
MKNKKSFMSGIGVGIVFIILFNIITTYFSPFSFAATFRMSPSKKIDVLLKIINDTYIGEYTENDLEESMYAGLLYGVGDPYTSYFNKDEYLEFKEQSNGSFTGIGVQIVVDVSDNTIKVTMPFKDSASYKAGILPNDKIIKVDGVNVFGDELENAISMIKGKIGTIVNITVFRESTKETLNFDILREVVEQPTIEHKVVAEDIGYIQITNFDEVTYKQFELAYNELNSQNIKGLIVDVRNNPGGLLHIVADITDLLVPAGGNIVYTEDKQGKIIETKSKKDNFGKPLAIIVNGNSASASEVLTGAVKDYGVGDIIGTTTFGKGIVQSLIPLRDGSAIKITSSKYFTPKGISIHGEGIVPDVIVELPEELSYRISSLTLEEDVQLQKAIENIKSK